MQKVIIEEPYQFIEPYRSTWWSSVIKALRLQTIWLRRAEGVVSHEVRGIEHLEKSLAAGHGIMLAPNHSRNGDPIAIGWLATAARCHVYAMASWHLFHQSAFTSFAIRRMGGFSINREGVDNQSIKTAIEILATAERPLILFPEGVVSRTNDRLQSLLDGVSFIARTAARRRAKAAPDSQVVIHPVGIKYLYQGDIDQTADEVLSDLEKRLGWKEYHDLALLPRIRRMGDALLTLKEVEYFGQQQPGKISERIPRLIERLLQPLEEEWLDGPQPDEQVVPRVKALRMKIVPEIVEGVLDPVEYRRRWSQLADIYLSQQLSCYPLNYLRHATTDRILETLERFEEDLTDQLRVHGKLHAVLQVDEPIVVPSARERRAETDPLMVELRERMEALLRQLAQESPRYPESCSEAER